MNLSLSGIVFGVFIGLILLVYPYFVGNWIAILGIAAALVGGLAFVSHLGY